MFGSANLTSHGILARTELGMLIDDPAQVQELQQWFDGLWASTASPIIEEGSALVAWLDEESYKSTARLQTFALAGETQKIRARLIKTNPKPARASAAALDLCLVAQELVSRDLQRYESLDAALLASIDMLANQGFTLGEAVRLVRQGYPDGTVREIYFLLLQHCANHPRSVYVETTINRMVLTDGARFVQSDKERLPVAIAKFDLFLTFLVQHLTLDEPKALPSETLLERETSILGRDQEILVGELIECGLLRLVDLPGELTQYILAEDFDWSGRFRFFAKAALAWKAALAKPRRSSRQVGEGEDQSMKSQHQMGDALRLINTLSFNPQMQDDAALVRVIEWLSKGGHRMQNAKTLVAEIQKATKIGKQRAKRIAKGSGDLPRIWLTQPIPDSEDMLVTLNPWLTTAKLKKYPRAAALIGKLPRQQAIPGSPFVPN